MGKLKGYRNLDLDDDYEELSLAVEQMFEKSSKKQKAKISNTKGDNQTDQQQD